MKKRPDLSCLRCRVAVPRGIENPVIGCLHSAPIHASSRVTYGPYSSGGYLTATAYVHGHHRTDSGGGA